MRRFRSDDRGNDRGRDGGRSRGTSGGRRTSGARPTKGTKPAVPRRPANAEFGRATRGLVGPARGGRGGSGFGGISLSRARLGRLFRPARAAGLLGMLACGFALTFVTGPSAFGLSRAELPTLTWTSEQAMRDALSIPNGGNVFRLDTAPLVAALRALPGVADARIAVELPDAIVRVSVDERVPVLAWQVGDTRYIADRDGVIFATLAGDAALPAGMAVIEDRRVDPEQLLAIGSSIDAVDLDVATRLGSLTPAQIGSTATRLRVAITERDGFVVFVQGGWNAVFGFYSPQTRPAGMIPGQVRLLKSLLDGREAALARIILASETDGTYVPRATPKPTPR